MRSARLTWRIHRFETLFVLVIGVLLGVAAWVIASQIDGIGLSDACWPRTEDGDYATRECDRLMQTFWEVTGGSTGYLRIALTVAPLILGLVLGVPLVARELELRTAGFAWALTPSRARWLLTRFLPMLLVGVVGFGVMAWAGTTLYEAMWLGRYGPDTTEIGAQGLALLMRGLMALGLGLLVGSIIGRTAPALLVAVALAAAWGLAVVPLAQGRLANDRAMWVSETEERWRNGDEVLTYVAYGSFDTSLPGIDGEPGARVDLDALYNEAGRQSEEVCGPQPDDDTGESPEWQTWSECADPIFREVYQRESTVGWNKVVLRSTWADFVILDVAMSTLVGGGALLLSFLVVARRRPE